MPYYHKLLFVFAVFIYSNTGIACLIQMPDAYEFKNQTIPRLASLLGVSPANIQPDDLLDPDVMCMDGLGANCSGYESCIITSAFDITIVNRFLKRRCVYRGVIIVRGLHILDPIIATRNETNCESLLYRRQQYPYEKSHRIP